MNTNFLLNTISTDAFISVNKKLIREIGLDCAATLSEIISRYKYFKDRGQLTEDGYFYNTFEDLGDTLDQSRMTQYRIITRLVGLNLLCYRLQGSPPKRFFKPNFEEIERLLSKD